MKLSNDCIDCFSSLSCGTRISILNLLQEEGRMSVMQISKYFQVKQPTITHHLKYLERVGLIASQKKGTKVYYYIHQKCEKGVCGFL